MNLKDDSVFTKCEQIRTISEGFRHVVVLGAGASRASCRDNPEKSGKSLPLMNDLPKIIHLDNELKDLSYDLKNENFENIFSTLFDKEAGSNRLKAIESKIYTYFATLKLLDTPTIYDYLVLSLREKDLVATFNWDPFLWQAWERNFKFTDKFPKLAFLHGNVAIGISNETKTYGPSGRLNLSIGKTFEPTRLLYPVKHKDYNSDIYIKDQWNILSQSLKSPERVTVFGYSAPATDMGAISIMKESWGSPKTGHCFTQFEIIDIQDKAKLIKSWKPFIYGDHYEVTNNFFKSSIFQCPRRTGEVFSENRIEGKWYDENPHPNSKLLKKCGIGIDHL